MAVVIILSVFIIACFLMLMFLNGCSNKSDKQKEDVDQMKWIREYNRRKRDSKIWIEKQL